MAPDPCPGCKPFTVCRTPSCGRLQGSRPAPIPVPVQSVSADKSPRQLKDHEVAELVNTLTAVAKTYRDSAQLRCRISHVVLDTLTSHNLKVTP